MHGFSGLPRLIMRPLFILLLKVGFALRIEGREHLKALNGRAIFAGNHTGFLDGPIVLASIPHAFRFVVAQDVLSWPVIGRLLPWFGIVPLNRRSAKTGLKEACKHLQQERKLCLFPEGKLSPDGSLGPFHPGVGRLHLQTQAPIIPFAIHGGFEAWPWGRPWPTFRKLYIRFGPPLSHWDEAALTTALRSSVEDMKKQLEAKDTLRRKKRP